MFWFPHEFIVDLGAVERELGGGGGGDFYCCSVQDCLTVKIDIAKLNQSIYNV